MVFQDYGLFPHLSVRENIGFGLGKSGQNERDRRIKELLTRIDLLDFESAYPHELSGGQQQRVALARSLAPEPELILLDEPFSNLDVGLREKLSRDVREIIKDSGATALMVTHNQHEAFAIADEIGIIMDGKLLQWGSGQDLYHRPRTSVVGRFIGEGAILPGTVKDRTSVETPVGLLKGKLTCNYPAGQKVSVLLRPEDIVHDDGSRCKAMVMESAYRGSHIMYTLQLQSGHNIMALVPSHHDHPEGSAIGIHAVPEDIVVFDA
jgi:iron(III) transport system ATP-binding protein